MSSQSIAIRFNSVTKQFGSNKPLLENADLEIPSGQFVAIVGESGCGKSTLLNLVAGLETAAGGTIEVLGQSVSHFNEAQFAALRRRDIGFVFQAFLLLPYLSVERNIALTMALNGHTQSDIQARVSGLLHRLGISSKANAMPRTLSGGETQRAAVARAFAHSPSILLADEPTGNLDEASANEVLKLFVEAVREEKRTCMLVTHSPHVAQQADVVYRLARGRLVREA